MENQILLVDDDVDLLDAFKESLEIQGYSIITATNGINAVESYKQKIPCITFMDIKMPKMDGYDAFSKIRELDPNAKVVFITGNANTEKTKIAKNNGLIEILYKPVTSENIVKLIRENNC